MAIALVLVMVMATGVALVACNGEGDGGGSGTGGGGTTETGTYNLKIWCAELDREMIEEMLYNYELDNPNNTYNWTVQNVGEDKSGSQVVADPLVAADVYSFASDQMGTLVNSNAIMAVPNDYATQIGDTQISIADTAAKYNGRYYAYPYTYENVFLYYNKSMLSESQVGSLESILATNVSAEYALGMDMGDAYYTSIFLFTAGMRLFGENGTDINSVDLDNNATKLGLQYIKSLNGKKKFNSIAEEDQSTALKNGQCAAIISGPHMVAEFKTALGANYGVAKLPTISLNGTATQMVSFSGVKLYGVNPNSKHSTEAAKLAMYLSNYDNQFIRLDEREFCPTNAELYEEAMESSIEAVEVVIEQAEYTQLKPAFTKMTSYWTPMASFLEGVYKNLQAESVWSSTLKGIEDNLKD